MAGPSQGGAGRRGSGQPPRRRSGDPSGSPRGGDQRGSRRSGPGVPEGAKGRPVGADRARTRADAPPRAARPTAPGGGEPRAPRPDLPVGDKPQIPKPVRRDIDRILGPGKRADEVALALSVGSQAIEEGVVAVALSALAWAKDQAPRVAAIREAYGVARYLDEDFTGALTELQAYARLTGRVDQQHVVADCLRALDRGLERVEAAVRPLLDDERAPAGVRAEGAIVLAAATADAGDLGAARQQLDGLLATRRKGDEEHHLRVRSLAAELAERAGDQVVAVRHLEALLAADPSDAFDARARLDAFQP